MARVDGSAEQEEQALLARCREGDGQAWRTFYQRHFSFVLRTARQLGTPPEELEDVAQEVFTVVSRRLAQFESGKVTTWMHRVCANVVSDHHRRRRVRRALSPFVPWLPWARLEEHRTPEQSLAQTQARAQVARILEKMAPRKREVFVLFEIEQLGGEEIAERVGCPVETVWTRLFHARKEFARLGSQQALLETARSGR